MSVFLFGWPEQTNGKQPLIMLGMGKGVDYYH